MANVVRTVQKQFADLSGPKKARTFTRVVGDAAAAVLLRKAPKWSAGETVAPSVLRGPISLPQVREISLMTIGPKNGAISLSVVLEGDLAKASRTTSSAEMTRFIADTLGGVGQKILSPGEHTLTSNSGAMLFVVQDANRQSMALLKQFPSTLLCKRELDSLEVLRKAKLSHAKGPTVLAHNPDCILYQWIEGGSLQNSAIQDLNKVPAKNLGKALGELGHYNPTRASVSSEYLQERTKRLMAVTEMALRNIHDKGLGTTLNLRTVEQISRDARVGPKTRAGLVHEDTHLGNWMKGRKLTLIDTAGLLRSIDAKGIPRGLPAIDKWGTIFALRLVGDVGEYSPAVVKRVLQSFEHGYQSTYPFHISIEAERFAQLDRGVWQLYFVTEHSDATLPVVIKSLQHIEEQFGTLHVPRRKR
jgi:hypothetical protein